MKDLHLTIAATVWILSTTVPAPAQDHMTGIDMPMKHSEKMPAKSALQPPEGASVKIVTPKTGEVLKGGKVPVQFKLTKRKRDEHVHAYVDSEMMRIFKSEKGTLNDIKPGQHTLELRVVTGDTIRNSTLLTRSHSQRSKRFRKTG